MGNKSSFGQWCLDNNHDDYLNLWDYDKNTVSPYDITKRSNKKCYFKCGRGIHDSELKDIFNITGGHKGSAECKLCNSIAQYIIDLYGKNGLEVFWDYKKNDKSPWDISKSSSTYIWIFCQSKPYHGSHRMLCGNFIKGIRCNIHGTSDINSIDSLGYKNKNVFNVWSTKNDKTPYDYTPYTHKKVLWKCENDIHEDYSRDIASSLKRNFKCPGCVTLTLNSTLQSKVVNYISNNFNVLLNHERKCSLIPVHPKNKYPLPFDNIIENYKLVIEVNGIQHYKLNYLHILRAKQTNNTPEQEFHYQQLKDRYKKYVAFCKGYFYLEIPYWTEDDESYKKLIDDKIAEILFINQNKQVI